MKAIVWSLPIVSMLALTAQAEEVKPFSMDASVGGLITSGNTDSTTFKAKVDIKQDFAKWRNNYLAEAIYKEDEVVLPNAEKESQTTAEKYGLSVQSDYKLNEQHRGLFVFGSYEEDRFSGYDYQGTIATGYTDRFLKTDNAEWNYSVGIGSSFDKTDDQFDENGVLILDGESNSSAIVRLAFDYRYSFNKNTKFTQTFSSDVATESDANTKTKAESALTATLNGSFALRLSFAVTHNSEVPEEIENSDTQTSVTLVYTL